MKELKKKDLKKLSRQELEEKLREIKEELRREMAASEVNGAVKNPGRIRELRRMVARITTLKRNA